MNRYAKFFKHAQANAMAISSLNIFCSLSGLTKKKIKKRIWRKGMVRNICIIKKFTVSYNIKDFFIITQKS